MTFGRNDDVLAKFMLTALGAFAETESSLIRERQREGIAIAMAKGVYKGRAKKLTPAEVIEIREPAAAGTPKSDLPRAYGVSRETLYTYLRAATT
jgi:DNA invertase Pin-like site-specific DNA recombinase